MAVLVLLPTIFERDQVVTRLQNDTDRPDWRVELCGFGPVVSAARTAQLLARYRPDRVLLLGIAGSYTGDASLATACSFDGVVSHGVGIGEADAFVSATRLGWSQWSDPDRSRCIDDTIWITDEAHRPSPPNVLLTCCAGAANQEEAERRRLLYPQAIAEDMEGFGVAAACQLAAVPLSIIRGMSNLAGDRDHRRWQSAAALKSAAELACQLLSRG